MDSRLGLANIFERGRKIMKKTWCSVLTFLVFVFCFSGIASAQEITGSIVGTVKDSSGAAVVGATVTITDPSKNNLVVRTAVTNDNGVYSIPNVQIGKYTVTVEAPNFKKSVNTNIEVLVGQRRPVDVTLEAGRIDETVTVTADQVAVELNTPTVGTTLNKDQLTELSVNNRNFVQLVTLAPGVSSNLADQVYVGTTNPEGQANVVSISVNGARSSQNTFTVDGSDITDRGSNITIQAYPSLDSICNYRVLRSLYPAESGRSGGGQVNLVGCGGGNEFHGNFFEFVRNEKLNANSYQNNRLAPLGRDSNGKAIRPPFRYNNFGFTIGGPIYFLRFGEHDPDKSMFAKMKRTFFFFSEEQRRDRRFPTLTSIVPSAGMRNGVFSFPICLSGTISGSTRTCNQILPAGTPISSMVAINPTSAAYVTDIFSRIPTPNSGTYTLVFPASAKADFQQEIIRIDTSPTKNWSAYYRYERDKIPTIDVNSLFSSGSGIPGVSTSQTDSPGRTHTFQTTYVISPKMIVEGRYNYSYGAILSTTIGLLNRANSPHINVPLPYPLTDERVPHLSISGLNGLVAFGPYDNFSDKHEFAGSFTWIIGSHTTKYGASFSKYRKNENQLGGANQGSFSGFNNTTPASPTQGNVCVNTAGAGIACSGNNNIEQSFANFLIGTNVTFSQSKFDLTADFRQRNFEAYAQDEFRLKRNLTLYYGVRYSFFGSPWDRNGHLSNFAPEFYNRATAPQVRGDGTRVTGSGNFCDGIIINAQNFTTGPAIYNCNPTPSPFGKFIVDVSKKNFAPRVGLAWDPFGKGTTVIRAGYGIYHEQTLVGTFEQLLGANPPYQETITVSGVNISNPVPGSTGVVFSASPPGAIRGIDTDYKTPYTQHWSLDVQRQFGKKTLVSVGYYGSKGVHLIGIGDINNLPPGYAFSLGLTACAVGASTTPTAPCHARDATGAPIAFTSAASELILDQIRPYRGWRGIAMIQPRYNSNYHSMQVSATHRFTGASQVQLAYTWSKNLTDNQTDRSTAPMDIYNIQNEYGRAQLDRRHITTVNYIYELPWFSDQKGFVGKALGGWQFSGIVTYQTGLPFTPTFGGFDPGGLGLLNGSSPAGGRPYVFCNPNEGGNHTFEEWFNYGCLQFTVPTGANPFGLAVGNAPRGFIEGPPTFRIDFTVTKNLRFSERYRLQLKAEVFNLLNHTNFTTLSTAASTPHSISPTTGIHSGFGTVTGTRDPRTMQFGIKFSY
jgi:hypothetical protein